MQLDFSLTQDNWFLFLSQKQQALVKTGLSLVARARTDLEPLEDYSYLIFPFAKTYEGFIKRYLYQIHLISDELYADRYFRIGRALNRDIKPDLRDEHWLFDDISQVCSSELAVQMWEAWLKGRNQVFHYFPRKQSPLITLEDAIRRVTLMTEAMEAAVACLPSKTFRKIDQ